MGLRSLRARWNQRRLDLAMNQIQNPACLDDITEGDPRRIQFRLEMTAEAGLNALSRAKSKTDWKGD